MLIHLSICPEKGYWSVSDPLDAFGLNFRQSDGKRPLEELVAMIEPGYKNDFRQFLTNNGNNKSAPEKSSAIPLQLALNATGKYQSFILEGYFVNPQGQQQAQFYGSLRLENSETDIDQILNYSGDMLALLDTNLIFRKLNNAYAEMFNKTPEEMIGKSIAEAFAHDEHHYQLVVAPILKRCLDNEPTNYEQWLDVPDMGKMHLTIRYSPVCDSEGKVEAIAVVCQNSTEIMRSVDALKQSEHMLKMNADIAGLGGWSYDVATAEMRWTDQMYEIHGVEKGFIPTNETLRKQFSDADWALMERNLKDNIQGKKTDCIVELITPAGIKKWVRVMTFPVLGQNEKITEIMGVMHDVTDMVESEKELESQKAMFETLAETSRDVISRFDRSGKYIYMNSAITAFTGRDKSFYIGKTHRDCNLSPDALEFWENLLQKTISSKTPTSDLLYMRDLSGIPVTFDCRMYPEINAEGELENIVCISRDINEWLKFEDEMQKLEKLESLGLMAGGIAHDFNNILTMLFGNISLAKSDISQSSPAYHNLEKAEEAFFRASRLTNQLLTFAKGGSPIRKKLSLSQMIEDVAKFDITGSNVKLKLEIAADLQDAFADQAQLEQVFTNLAMNAIQSMPNGGLLTIRASNLSIENGSTTKINAGDYIKIEFEDEGEGIPHNVINRIFDPYFTTKDGGSGLGLATVFSVISKHKGTVEVDSLAGKGSRFTVILPVNKVLKKSSATHVKSLQEVPAVKHRILIMDDEKMICDMAKVILQRAGYMVESAESGEKAIVLYKQALDEGRSFDCVIMDLTIPGGIGGKEAIHEILKFDPDVRAIVSSGYSDDPVMASYNEFGFRGVLPKPFTAGMMQDAIATTLLI